MHRFLMLRSELLHFIRCIYFHCSCVITDEWRHWDRCFLSISSIQDFRHSFESFSGRILKRCFLESDCRPVLQHVLFLLGTALKLRLQFESMCDRQARLVSWTPSTPLLYVFCISCLVCMSRSGIKTKHLL